MSARQVYTNLKHAITRALRQLLNPALCITCGISIKASSFICLDCLQSLEVIINPCRLCGLPNSSNIPTCPLCLKKPPLWQAIVSPLVFNNTSRSLLHDLKFKEKTYVATALATHFKEYYLNRPVDTLIPVPLHPNRLRDRGFNQSKEIASELSYQLSIPIDCSSLHRVRETDSQAGLSEKKRKRNILNAFSYRPKRLYQSVAIVDDIVTTGSTTAEITRLLQRKGIQHVEVWSFARALKQR